MREVPGQGQILRLIHWDEIIRWGDKDPDQEEEDKDRAKKYNLLKLIPIHDCWFKFVNIIGRNKNNYNHEVHEEHEENKKNYGICPVVSNSCVNFVFFVV